MNAPRLDLASFGLSRPHADVGPLALRHRHERAVAKSRRDFLSWLAAGTALTAVGCATAGSGSGEGDDDGLGSTDQAQNACIPTTKDAQGPYFEPGSPYTPLQIASPSEPGVRLFVEGSLVGPDCRTPLRGYTLDIWQADSQGNYYPATGGEYRLRGKVKTDADGKYSFETILPGRYGDSAGIRPAHLHVSYLSPANNVILTTQLYFEGDPYLGQADYCTREGSCNSADGKRHLVLRDGLVGRTPGKRSSFSAILPRA
jgi:protocatechuate 3,4-dioxygenase beta subunit